MSRACPRCRLINPDGALRCDCGYDFGAGEVKASYLRTSPEQQASPQSNVVLRFLSIGRRIATEFLDVGIDRLIRAANSGDTATVLSWLRARVSPNSRSEISRAGVGPKSTGWLAGDTAVTVAGKAGHLEIVQVLVEAGAELDLASEWMQRALQAAAERNETGFVETLLCLAPGADPEFCDDSGRTPLLKAAKHSHVDAVRALLASGANANNGGNSKETPLVMALGFGTIGLRQTVVQVLIEAGADVNLESVQTAPEFNGSWSEPPLNTAAGTGGDEEEVAAFVKMLLQAGADVNGVVGGTPPLHETAHF